MIKNIIFDFDGTIVDSVDIKMNAFAHIYEPFGDKIVKGVINYHQLNGGVSRFEKFKYFHKSFLNIDLNEKEIKKLADTFSNIVINKVINAPYVPGVIDFISKNYKKYNMFISTATPTDEIIKILGEKTLTKYFKEIKGSPETKTDHVQQIITKNNYLRNETIYIGDSDSDKEAAFNNKIKFIRIIKSHETKNKRNSKYEKNYFKINNFRSLGKILQNM